MTTAPCDTPTPEDLDPVLLDRIDYADRFELRCEAQFDHIDDFVRTLALRQPSWLTQVSMGIRDRAKIRVALGDGPLVPGMAAGNWRIVDRSNDTVVFAEDMGIMRYRLTYRWHDPQRISARTEVALTSRWFGPVYWRLATPMHRRFLPMMLRNAAAGPCEVVEQAS